VSEPVKLIMMDDHDEAPDAVLATRAGTGDAVAFGALVRRHHAAAIRLATVVGGSVDEAPDIVQEAWVKAYRALPRQTNLASVRSWLLRVVANEAHNSRRGRERRLRRDDRYSATPAGAASRADAMEAALAELDATAVWSAVHRLGDRDRQIIGYRYFAGLSEAETAEALGTAVGTVKSRTARALARLRDEVGATTGPEGGAR
jgi:RNA polymerase sigma-70 factor (ECF subfamily)